MKQLGHTSWILFIPLLFLSLKAVDCGSKMSPELQLYELLSANYSRLIRPVLRYSDVVVINTTMHFYQLLDFDEKREVIETVIWIQQEWFDAYLIWDPDDHEGVKQLVLPADNVWVPDLYILNLVGDADNTVTPFLGTMETLIVHSNGQVGRYSPYRVTTSCPVDLLKFPFDEQTCHFTYGSWAYSSEQLYYQILADPIIIPYHTSADWVLTAFTGTETYYPIENPPSNFSLVDFSLKMKRRPLYHITYLIIPSMMLNMIVSFSFFLPPEAGERVSVGLTSFLAYSVVIMMMADKIPESTTTMPLISLLFLINMTLTMVTILWSVVAIRIHFRASAYGLPPSWLLQAATNIESSLCSTVNRRPHAHPHVCNGETNAMIKRRSTAAQTTEGAQGSTGGLLPTSSSDPLNMKRASSMEGLQGSSRASVRTLEEMDCRDNVDSIRRKEIEESWKLVMSAADRTIFGLFMIASFVGLVLVFIAKAG